MNITVGLDTRFDDSLDLIRPFFDALYSRHKAASRKTEKFVRPRKDNKAQLLAEKIQRGRTQSGSGQSLLHDGKAGIGRAGGKKVHVVVRIEAEIFDDDP